MDQLQTSIMSTKANGCWCEKEQQFITTKYWRGWSLQLQAGMWSNSWLWQDTSKGTPRRQFDVLLSAPQFTFSQEQSIWKVSYSQKGYNSSPFPSDPSQKFWQVCYLWINRMVSGSPDIMETLMHNLELHYAYDFSFQEHYQKGNRSKRLK